MLEREVKQVDLIEWNIEIFNTLRFSPRCGRTKEHVIQAINHTNSTYGKLTMNYTAHLMSSKGK